MQNNDLISIKSFSNIPVDNEQYSMEFIERNQAIVLAVTEDSITVGITDKTSENTISTIRGYHSGNINFVYIDSVELSSWLGNKMGETNNLPESNNNSQADETTLLDKMANDAPTVNLVNSICIDAIRMKEGF